MPRLIVKSSGIQSEPFELKLGVNRVGRSHSNDFRIDHPTVSGAHCDVVYLDDAVVVRDRGSTNGTFIDGRPIQEAGLEAGQTFQLGEVELMLEDVVAAVIIPALELPRPDTSTQFPDGTFSCAIHPEVRASERCVQCQRCFCSACVHEVHLMHGKSLRCCPTCGGKCDPIPLPAPVQKKTLLGLLSKTLKMSFNPRRRTPKVRRRH